MIAQQVTGSSFTAGQSSTRRSGKADFDSLIFDDVVSADGKIKTISFNEETKFDENNVDSQTFEKALIQGLDTVEVVILDLRNVDYADGTFIGRINELNRKLNKSGRKLGLLLQPGGNVESSIKTMNFDKVLQVSTALDDLNQKLEQVRVGELKLIDDAVPIAGADVETTISIPTLGTVGRASVAIPTSFKDLIDGNPNIQDGILTISFKPDTVLTSYHEDDCISFLAEKLGDNGNNTKIVLDLTNVCNLNDSVLTAFVRLGLAKPMKISGLTFIGLHDKVRSGVLVWKKLPFIKIEEATS